MLTWIPLKTRMAPTISKAGPAAAPQSLYRTGWQLAKVRAILWLALACVIVIIRRLVRRAWTHYRWDGRPHRRP